jgi:hypothetical protein
MLQGQSAATVTIKAVECMLTAHVLFSSAVLSKTAATQHSSMLASSCM